MTLQIPEHEEVWLLCIERELVCTNQRYTNLTFLTVHQPGCPGMDQGDVLPCSIAWDDAGKQDARKTVSHVSWKI